MEGPGGLLEDDGGGGGGVVDDGDLVDVLGVDEVFEDGAGAEDPLLELVEVEVVGLPEVAELPAVLGGDDGRRAAPEAAVVDASDGGVVVGELRSDLGVGDGGASDGDGGGGGGSELWFFCQVVVGCGVTVEVVIVVMVMVVGEVAGGHWG